MSDFTANARVRVGACPQTVSGCGRTGGCFTEEGEAMSDQGTKARLAVSEFQSASRAKLEAQALALRTPPPPEKLIDALQDRIHQDLGTVRIAKSVRVKRDG